MNTIKIGSQEYKDLLKVKRKAENLIAAKMLMEKTGASATEFAGKEFGKSVLELGKVLAGIEG